MINYGFQQSNQNIQIQMILITLVPKSPTIILIIVVMLLSQPAAATLNWGLYRWIYNEQSLYEPITNSSIQLSHPQIPYLSLQIRTNKMMKQKYNAHNISEYAVDDDKASITLISQATAFLLQADGLQYLEIKVKCRQDDCRQASDIVNNYISKDLHTYKQCKQTIKYQYVCQFSNQSHLKLSFSLSSKQSQNHNLPIQKSALIQYFRQSTEKFLTTHKISTSTLFIEMAQEAFTSLSNSICMYWYGDRDDGEFFLGFCQQQANPNPNGQYLWDYNVKLAPFSIYLLADYYYQLAYDIYQDFFALVETMLLYRTDQTTQVLPLTEHIEVFTRFGSILSLQAQSQLLNSMFVLPMLNQLGTLHQQLNYRQAKKFHPLLLKMLTLKWSASSAKNSLRSLYKQSFTEDFRYHDYGQVLQQSICKMAWVYKVADTFTGINIKHHSYYMPVQQIKEHLQEHFTLLNIFKVYANDQNNAKFGRYKDIVGVGEGLKVYSRYNGYDAILPYVYGLGKTYPDATLKQLQTNFGLKSSTQQELQQYQKRYRYRGDIHTYFNVKLISGLIYRVQQDKAIISSKKSEIIGYLNALAGRAAKNLVDLFKKDGNIYTSWTKEGRGKQTVSWGKIVSVLLLKWANI